LDDRPHGRPIPRCGVEAAAYGYVPDLAGLNVMRRTAVIVVGVSHRPHDAELVGDLGQSGEVLADPEARGAAGDGTERTTDLLRRVGLEVEGLELARAAEEVDKDH